MPMRSRFGIGDEQIVADQLDLAAEPLGQRLPAVEIVLGHAVLDRADRIVAGELGEIVGHLGGRERPPLPFHPIGAVPEIFGRGAIEREHDVVARRVAGLLDRAA